MLKQVLCYRVVDRIVHIHINEWDWLVDLYNNNNKVSGQIVTYRIILIWVRVTLWDSEYEDCLDTLKMRITLEYIVIKTWRLEGYIKEDWVKSWLILLNKRSLLQNLIREFQYVYWLLQFVHTKRLLQYCFKGNSVTVKTTNGLRLKKQN